MLSTSGATALFVRDSGRRARPATRDEILAALGHIDYARAQGEKLNAPSAVARFLIDRLARLDYEVFGCVFVDNANKVLAVSELFRGTIDGASVYPREVVRAALLHNAASVILFHNHPSGSTDPSAADRQLTSKLSAALKLVDIRTLDHLIIAGAAHTSLAERGEM